MFDAAPNGNPNHRQRADSAECLLLAREAANLDEHYGSRAELLTRLESSLSFAQRTVENADPTHSLWAVDLGQVSGYEKMMMEAGLLALLVHRADCCREAANSLIQTIRSTYDSETALLCIRRHPRLACSLGSLILILERFGLATARERTVVHDALASPYANSSEHVPFRLLDRHWVLGMSGAKMAPMKGALRLTAACRETHPIYMTREDGYAVTHAVMYATDFGSRAAPLELRRTALWQTVDAAVAWCTAAGDFDLLAEFLLTQLLLRNQLSPYGIIAWHQSRETWDSLGFLPSPSLSAETLESLEPGPEQEQYAFHEMYHTICVGGLLCAALLGDQVTGSVEEPESCTYKEPPSVAAAIQRTVEQIQSGLGLEPAKAHEFINVIEWNAEATGLEDLARKWSRLGSPKIAMSMAIDASLILAAQKYDLSSVAIALRRAVQQEIITPTLMAGTDFLARQLPLDCLDAQSLNRAPRSSHDAVQSLRAGAALANCVASIGACFAPSMASLS